MGSTASSTPEDEGLTVKQAKEKFESLSDADLHGILDNLIDDANRHEISITHDAAVVDKEA